MRRLTYILLIALLTACNANDDSGVEVKGTYVGCDGGGKIIVSRQRKTVNINVKGRDIVLERKWENLYSGGDGLIVLKYQEYPYVDPGQKKEMRWSLSGIKNEVIWFCSESEIN